MNANAGFIIHTVCSIDVEKKGVLGVEVISQSRSEERNPELIAMKGYKCHMSQKSMSTAIFPRNFSSEGVWDTGPTAKHEDGVVCYCHCGRNKIHWLGNSEIGTFYSFPFCCCTFFSLRQKESEKMRSWAIKRFQGQKGRSQFPSRK